MARAADVSARRIGVSPHGPSRSPQRIPVFARFHLRIRDMLGIRWRKWLALCAGVSAAAGLAGSAAATEGGASVYLLGSGGPGAAILPPVEGVFLSNTLYHYQGKAGGDVNFPLGGNV